MRDTPHELSLWFVRFVHVPLSPALHIPSLMVQRRVNHSVFDRFRDDVFGIFLGIEMQLDAYIGKRDARVGKSDGSKSGPDDELSKAQDKEMGRVGEESLFVRLECFLEGGHIAHSDRCCCQRHYK